MKQNFLTANSNSNLLLYIIKYLCPNHKSIVYADVTTVIVTGRTVHEASQKCNSILERFT